ncbi:hypothetical protein, partial [Pseudomonas sp. SIMBA_044]|uniref:hypothetical protein n=1 Tax=Pseudomonas sp. SIMBA_044 TaxID=3085785 RepID=UPI00397E0AB8
AFLTETQVKDFENKDGMITVITDTHSMITSKNLVWATHIPPGNNRFSVLLAPYRSYVATLKLANPVKSMAQTADLYDPYHYARYHKSGSDYFLIVGGFDHKTGDENDTEKHFKDLMKYVDENFKCGGVVGKNLFGSSSNCSKKIPSLLIFPLIFLSAEQETPIP